MSKDNSDAPIPSLTEMNRSNHCAVRTVLAAGRILRASLGLNRGTSDAAVRAKDAAVTWFRA
jgi:hypothetical protein